MNLNKYTYNYFLFLFSIIPITIILGSAVSLLNILLIDFSFIIFLIYNKNFFFLKNKTISYLFILYIYLIFNSFISIDYSESILRNLGFLRIIILFIAFNYFYHQKSFFQKMFKSWLLIILIVVFDVYFEFLYGKNILGYDGSKYGQRIVSFFIDEPIVGSFLNCFFLILIGFFINKNKNKNNNYKYYIFFLIILFLVSIFITGERTSSLRVLLGISIFLILLKEINLNSKILLIFGIFLIIFISIFSISKLNDKFNLNDRFVRQILDQKHHYFDLYQSSLQVFKNNKIFGVGNKNYRVETCDGNEITSAKNKDRYICTTHPHQIYFELLSEHGIIGSTIILLIFYKLIFSKIVKTSLEKNYLKIGSLIYLILHFLPILPSGAFFSSFGLTLFAINLSIFYASDKSLNVFKLK